MSSKPQMSALHNQLIPAIAATGDPHRRIPQLTQDLRFNRYNTLASRMPQLVREVPGAKTACINVLTEIEAQRPEARLTVTRMRERVNMMPELTV